MYCAYTTKQIILKTKLYLRVWKIFELLTGRGLLKPDVEEGDPWTVEDDLLARMMELTDEEFSEMPMLTRSANRDHFFDDHGMASFLFTTKLLLMCVCR